jgi:hypothetical protein
LALSVQFSSPDAEQQIHGGGGGGGSEDADPSSDGGGDGGGGDGGGDSDEDPIDLQEGEELHHGFVVDLGAFLRFATVAQSIQNNHP